MNSMFRLGIRGQERHGQYTVCPLMDIGNDQVDGMMGIVGDLILDDVDKQGIALGELLKITYR